MYNYFSLYENGLPATAGRFHIYVYIQQAFYLKKKNAFFNATLAQYLYNIVKVRLKIRSVCKNGKVKDWIRWMRWYCF